MQRPVGSVGVEALPRLAINVAGLDNYCGVVVCVAFDICFLGI
jgi:hypothetical protein